MAFYHNRQIGNYKSADVVNMVKKNGDGLSVSSSVIYIGEIQTNKVLYHDDKDIAALVYNFIEYAILREEVRRNFKGQNCKISG